MMTNKQKIDVGSDERGSVNLKTRKAWIAPQMTMVSIAELTQSNTGASNDGSTSDTS